MAYLEFMKAGGATFDKLKSCNKAESQTEFLVGVWMIFHRESQVMVINHCRSTVVSNFIYLNISVYT